MSLTDEMRAAARIQNSLLPRTLPSTQNLEVAVRYAPMTAVAGDLYDFPKVHPGSIGILVADVTGHGVPAALVASMLKIAVSMQTGRHGKPAKVISGMNSILAKRLAASTRQPCMYTWTKQIASPAIVPRRIRRRCYGGAVHKHCTNSMNRGCCSACGRMRIILGESLRCWG